MKEQVKDLVTNLGISINRNSPSILIGLGISGFIGSIILAVKSTPTAQAKIEDRLYYGYTDSEEYYPSKTFDQYLMSLRKDGYQISRDWLTVLSPQETLKTIFPVYLPTAIITVLSATAIVLGNRIHLKRAAALASVYTLAENTLRTYQEKVLETVGKTKSEQIRGAVIDEELRANPPSAENTHNVGGGNELCYEMSTGRYFWSDAEKIRAAANQFNKELMSENVKTLNEFYYDLGLPMVELGNYVGWEIDDGLIDVLISARVSDAYEKPCLVLDFVSRPKFLWTK